MLKEAMMGSCRYALLLICLTTATAWADGRLLATGAVSQVEGAAGGGLVPWAVLAGYGTRDEGGGTAFFSHVGASDYSMTNFGAAYTFGNRVELSIARNEFGLGTLGKALGMPGASLRQNVFGVKLRVAGDLVYTAYPQISVGLQHKRNLDFSVPRMVGAVDDSGTDLYLGASKLFLAGLQGRHVLLHGGVRATKANEIGILGFGGDRGNDYEALFEAAAAVMLNRRIAFGGEYRQKPNNLGFSREDDWKDVFFAFFPNKQMAFVAAYVDLGTVATLPEQKAWYVSMQLSY